MMRELKNCAEDTKFKDKNNNNNISQTDLIRNSPKKIFDVYNFNLERKKKRKMDLTYFGIIKMNFFRFLI